MPLVLRTNCFVHIVVSGSESEQRPIPRTGCPSIPVPRRCKRDSWVVLDAANAAFLDPLLATTGNRPHQQERPAIAALGIDDRDVDGKVLASQRTGLTDVERQRTCVLFAVFMKSSSAHRIKNTL